MVRDERPKAGIGRTRGAGKRDEMSELRLMAVHAHPDDESSKGAASLAKYSAEGAGVVVVSCTGGERGDILNPAMDLPDVHGRWPRSAATRWPRPPRFSGSTTTGWASSTPGCRRAIRRHRCRRLLRRGAARGARRGAGARGPQVQATRDDHLRRERRLPASRPHPCHVVSVGAFEAAGDSGGLPDAGEPWQPLKLYYNVGFSRGTHALLQDEFGQERPVGPVRQVDQAFGGSATTIPSPIG